MSLLHNGLQVDKNVHKMTLDTNMLKYIFFLQIEM